MVMITTFIALLATPISLMAQDRGQQNACVLSPQLENLLADLKPDIQYLTELDSQYVLSSNWVGGESPYDLDQDAAFTTIDLAWLDISQSYARWFQTVALLELRTNYYAKLANQYLQEVYSVAHPKIFSVQPKLDDQSSKREPSLATAHVVSYVDSTHAEEFASYAIDDLLSKTDWMEWKNVPLSLDVHTAMPVDPAKSDIKLSLSDFLDAVQFYLDRFSQVRNGIQGTVNEHWLRELGNEQRYLEEFAATIR